MNNYESVELELDLDLKVVSSESIESVEDSASMYNCASTSGFSVCYGNLC